MKENSKTDLSDLMLNDKGFAFDPSSGDSYQLNETGLLCIKALQSGNSESEIAKRIADSYDVDELRAKSDVDAFLGELERIGWR